MTFRLISLFLLCSTIPPLVAQSQSPAVLPQLVRTRAVVQDASGAPITDLNINDFKIADQGKALAVTHLHTPYSAHPSATAAAGEVVSRSSQQPPHTTAILVDLLNLMQANRLDSFRRIEQALPKIASGDRTYLYLLNVDGALETLVPMQDGKATPIAPPKDWHKNASQLLEKSIKSLARPRPAGMLQEDVVKKTYVALETMANQLAAFPGTRDIVWVTDGVPSIGDPRRTCSGDWMECSLYVQHLSVTLERAGVAVNTLSYAVGLSPGVTIGMEDIAGLTGGRPVFGQEMHAVVEQLEREAGTAYLLVAAPPQDAWDGKFHKLRVTCDRKGAKVLARQRLYAYPDHGQVPAMEYAAMTALLKQPADAPEIGLRGRIAPGSKPGAAMVQIRIDPSDLVAVEQGSNVLAQVSVIYAQYGANELLAAPPPSTFNLNLPRTQFEATKKDGLAFDQEIPLSPKAKSLRFVIYDRGSRFLGSVTLPVPAIK